MTDPTSSRLGNTPKGADAGLLARSVKTIAVAVLLHAAFTVSLPWLIVRATSQIAWLHIPLGPLRWIGAIGIGFGAYLYVSSLAHLLTLRTAALPGEEPIRLVTSGWYARVRHPLLLGIVLILLGEAAAFRSLALLGFALL